MNQDMIAYYARRAKEYEKTYHRPERQEDLLKIRKLLPEVFTGKKVLEIGCGTGYWTPSISQTAESVLATDINTEVIDIARQKAYPTENVKFMEMDMYQPKIDKNSFNAIFAGFIWSHIPLEKTDLFLKTLYGFLSPGGEIIFLDNQYVEGSNTPVSKTDQQGNTYQVRKLEDGSEHLVLKNFPDDADLHRIAEGNSLQISITRWKYYWMARLY